MPSPETADWYSDAAATFGDRLAAAREARGMTEEMLAKRLGVKLKTVKNWEEDVAEPRANKLSMLAGVLNVSFRWLLTGEGSEAEAPAAGAEIEPDLAELLTEMRQLRAEMGAAAQRLGRLEKRLAETLRAAA